MANWRTPVVQKSKRPATPGTWRHIMQSEPPAPVVADPPQLVEVVEGVYQPLFVYCADCGKLMFWRIDHWQCYCGRTVEDFSAERIVKREAVQVTKKRRKVK